LEDRGNTPSQVFRGLTLAFARCHNHKFEPLTMLDYYRMVAIFNPLQRPQAGREDTDLPVGTRQQVEQIARRDEQIAVLRRPSLSQAATMVGGSFSPILWLSPAVAGVKGFK